MAEDSVLSKSRILDYLEYGTEQVDLYKFSRWLEEFSGGEFYVTKGKRPNPSMSKQLRKRF